MNVNDVNDVSDNVLKLMVEMAKSQKGNISSDDEAEEILARQELVNIKEEYFRDKQIDREEEDEPESDSDEGELISAKEFEKLFRSLKMKFDPEGRVL